MIKSLKLINSIKTRNDIPESEIWLRFLYCTAQNNVNLRNIPDVNRIPTKSTFNYVKRCLEYLNHAIDNYLSDEYTEKDLYYVEETLKWSEVAKCGNKFDRAKWIKAGYDLNIHNEASAEIYKDNTKRPDEIL
jgi:hypothetical protein